MMPPQPPAPSHQTIAPGPELLLERLRPYPARVLSRTMDVLASNHNIARYVFLHLAARSLFADRMLRSPVARPACVLGEYLRAFAA
jgi:hypothetical protein